MGYPGSGKSTFCKTHLPSYTRVNLDDMKSFKKCVSAMEEALGAGKSVVVDNTNPDPNNRKRWVDKPRSYFLERQHVLPHWSHADS